MTQLPTFSSQESRWNAVLVRNRAAEGVFYYAVKTTGIVCHPVCPSRRPKRKNVEFFDTYDEAKEAGYRACKRCKPC